MKYIFFLMLSVLVFSCKTPQKLSSETHLKEETTQQNNIELYGSDLLSKLTEKVVQNILNQKLNISIEQTKYDTDKPIDTITGKPPIKEESKIKINKETEQKQSEKTTITEKKKRVFKLKDKSKTNRKLAYSTTDKKETGLSKWQLFFITTGISFFIGLILFIISKIK